MQSQKCYLLFDEEIVIPDKIKEHLGTLSPSECPEKLKTAEKVKITFAVELDKNNKPIIPKHAKLFSYLPTDILSGLPFWVNGEFLLKQDRGHLLNNEWNQFLLREIGKRQFCVLKYIAESMEMRLHVISLLPPDKMSNAQLTDFKYSYDEGFSEGAAETEFIPAVDSKLLKLSECVLDKHNFFAKEGGFVSSLDTTALFPDVFIGNKALIIEHSLEQKDKLIPFCNQRIFTIEHLLEKLEDYVKIIYPRDKAAFKKLLRFLARLNDYQFGDKLNQKRWLPLINGVMQCPSKCFLSNGGENPFAKQFALDLLDETILPDETEEKLYVENWLISTLNAARINPVDVIRIHFFKLIQDNQVNEQLSKEMLSFIRYVYLTNTDNHNVISILQEISAIFPIYIQNTPLPLNQCLMPEELLEQQIAPIQQQIQHKIPRVYYKADTPDEIKSVREFFLCLGVKAKLDFKHYARIAAKSAQKLNAHTANYAKYIKENKVGTVKFFEADNHTIGHLVVCDFIDKINLPGYQNIFWDLLLNYEQYIFNCAYYTPSATIKTHPIISFIEYYLQNVACLDAKNKTNLFTINQLFSSRFAKEFPEFPFAVANIPECVPEIILKHLGCKTTLSLTECAQLLRNDLYSRSPEYLRKIYHAIISAYRNADANEKSHFIHLIKNISLLSANGNAIQVDKLLLYNEYEDTPNNDLFFNPCGLLPQEQKELAIIFNLKLFINQAELSKLDITHLEDQEKEEEIKTRLLLTIFGFMHVATLMSAKNKGYREEDKIEEIAKDYLQKLSNLKLCCCDQLNYSFEQSLALDDSISSDKTEQVRKKDGIIFFTIEAYEELSPKLINGVADMLFYDEKIKSAFERYMNRNASIRHEEINLKNFGNVIEKIKKFFHDEKSIFFARKIISKTQPSTPTKLIPPIVDQDSSFNDPEDNILLPFSPILPKPEHNEITDPAVDNELDPPFVGGEQSQKPDSRASSPAPTLTISKGKIPERGNRTPPREGYGRFFPPSDKGGGGTKTFASTQSTNEETGRKGENFFYNFLLKRAKEKLCGMIFTEDHMGFSMINDQGKIVLRVIWLNKMHERKQRRDLIVTYQDKDYIFEVKTTTETNMHAFISSSEVREMNNKKENYALVFITDINNKPQHFVQWNPCRKVAQGILQLIPVKYQIFSPAGIVAKTVNEHEVGPEQPQEVSHCFVS